MTGPDVAGLPMPEYLRQDLESRLASLETALLAQGVVKHIAHAIAKGFNEALHPRGRDGQFIETDGHVSGDFRDGNGNSISMPDAKIIGFKSVGATKDDPFVLVEGKGPDGKPVRAIARASEITASRVKARLDDQISIDYTSPSSVAASQQITTKAIRVHSVEEALTELAKGHKVELEHREDINILVEKMAAIAKEARDRGEQAPEYNLCDVTIADRSLFCENSKGIPRLRMPQLSGTPKLGSKADALPKDAKGRVDLSQKFREHLERTGAKITRGKMQASHLKASQNELDGPTVGRIAAGLDERPVIDPMFVSSDDYIVDGHHRWAASFVHDEDMELPVDKTDLPILDLLAEAVRFADDWGIEPQDIGSRERAKARADSPFPEWDPRSDPEFMARYPKWDEDSARVEAAQKKGLEAGLDTEAQFDRLDDIPGKYTQERTAEHIKLINHFLDRPKVKHEKKLLFIGGLPGSGKTTLLNSEIGQEKIGVNLDEYVIVNPDEVKAMMFEMGMYPDYSDIGLLSEGEAATLTHEESSYLSKIILKRAIADGMNVVVDTSLKKPEQFQLLDEHLGPLDQTGWETTLVLVDVPAEVAMQRAIKRYYDGEKRYTPLDFISLMRMDDGTSAPRSSYDAVKGLATRSFLFDNSNGPRLVESTKKKKSTIDTSQIGPSAPSAPSASAPSAPATPSAPAADVAAPAPV